MIKLTVSYERPEELQRVLRILGGSTKGIKTPKEQKGKYKKAYIELKE